MEKISAILVFFQQIPCNEEDKTKDKEEEVREGKRVR